MYAKLHTLRQIYRDETRFDWFILAANIAGVGTVFAAFHHARNVDIAQGLQVVVASSGF